MTEVSQDGEIKLGFLLLSRVVNRFGNRNVQGIIR
jgi:hypothetical protein